MGRNANAKHCHDIITKVNARSTFQAFTLTNISAITIKNNTCKTKRHSYEIFINDSVLVRFSNSTGRGALLLENAMTTFFFL